MLKNRAISAQLVELQKENIREADRNRYSNLLSLLVLRLTQNVDEAKALLDHDKAVIQEREKEGRAYLFGDHISARDLFISYYANLYLDEKGNRCLKENFTISELMLMTGVFSWFSEERKKNYASYQKDRTKLQNKKDQRGIYAFFPVYEDRKKMMNEELEILAVAQSEETRMIEYLENQSQIVMTRVLQALGLQIEKIPSSQGSSMYLECRKLCSESNMISCFFTRREKRKPSIMNDIEFLIRMGEEEAYLSTYFPRMEGKVKKYQG